MFCSWSAESAEIAIGVVCRFSSRFCAVTVTSSMAAAVTEPAISESNPYPIANVIGLFLKSQLIVMLSTVERFRLYMNNVCGVRGSCDDLDTRLQGDNTFALWRRVHLWTERIPGRIACEGSRAAACIHSFYL
jgi:hypothetical protein